MRVRPIAIASLSLLIAGCNGPSSLACTEIAAQSGIAVTVERGAAATLTALTIKACRGATCFEHPVVLSPGSDTVDQGCEGTGPDAPCSATAVPNGTKVGFVEMLDLPEGPLAVSATATRGRRKEQLPEVTIVSRTTYPNGVDCPGSGNQASLTVTAEGLR
jgi:hypothetical protein